MAGRSTQAPAATQAPTATPTQVQGASATEAPSEGGPQEGGIFRWHFRYPVALHLDPHFAGGRGAFFWMFMGNVAVRWNAPATDLTPELFDSWESADGLVHNVTVRPGVKTHNVALTNGRDFDAQDLAMNLMRISGLADPDNISSYTRRGGLRGMTDATAVDDSNVSVTFGEVAGHFPEGLTDYLMTFIPRENFENPDLFNSPEQLSGTGPFIVEQFVDGEITTFTRNPDFWGGQPHLDGVELRQLGDRVSQMADFLQGNAEYLENPSRVERETVGQQAPDAQIHAWPGSTCTYSKFNVRQAPFDDQRVRRALHLATNYVLNQEDYWGEGFFGLAGVINNAHGAAYSEAEIRTFPGWREAEKDADIAEGAMLLDAAGYPNGAGLDFKVLGTEFQQAYGYDFSIRQMDDWRRAYSDISVEVDLVADSATNTARQNEGAFDYAMRAAVSTSPASVDASQHYETGGAANIGGYSSAELDGVLERARTTLERDEATALIRQAEDILLEDLPGTITHRLYQAGIWSGSVRGLPTIPQGERALAGSFENWNSVHRHTAVIWLEK